MAANAGCATAIGGNGGAGGANGADTIFSNGGDGGNGGAAAATAATSVTSGSAEAGAYSTGGSGGSGGPGGAFNGSGGAGGAASSIASSTGSRGVMSSASAIGGDGGTGDIFYSDAAKGGDASASSTATSTGSGRAESFAIATGGTGGDQQFFVIGPAGRGGDALATADLNAPNGGAAKATATATGGAPGVGSLSAPALSSAIATSNAETVKGALAQALSTAAGSSGETQSTATTSFEGVSVQSTAMVPIGAPNGATAITNAIAQGGAGQAFDRKSGQTDDAFSTALPDKPYVATLIDGANNVAEALLGPRDKIFGTAILESNFLSDTVSSKFDFHYGGDLVLGLTDGSGGFSIDVNGVYLFESFADDSVINLGSNWGPNIDLTLMVANGASGDFAVGGAVPEASTWAMMLLGFAGVGFGGYRASRRTTALAAQSLTQKFVARVRCA